MERTIGKSVVAGVGLVVALLVGNAGLAYRNTRQLRDDASWVAHTHEVLDLTSDVLRSLVDAETGQRGFLITGMDSFLEPYDQALARLDEQVRTLKAKTQDNPRQQARIGELETLTAQRLALLKAGIDLRRQGALEAQAFIATGQGKARMDAVRRLVATMEEEEHGLLRDRERQSAAAYRTAVATELIAAALGLALVGVLVLLVRRGLQARGRAAALVHADRERLRTTLTSIGDGVIVTDAGGRVTLMNRVAQDLTGWTAGAAGRPLGEVFRIVNEHTRQPVESPVTKVLREGAVVGLANHTVLIARDGGEVPIDDSGAPIRDAGGEIVGVVLVFRDVTERRRAERLQRDLRDQLERQVQELRASEERLRLFVEHTPAAVAVLDRDMRYLLVSRRRLRDYGLDGQDVIGRSYYEVFPNVPERWKAVHRRCLAGATERCEEDHFIRPDGQEVWLHWEICPWRDPRGAIGGVIIFSEVITDRKRAQEAVREADRRKDEFLAMLAHELRNPLAPIRNSLHIMRQPGVEAAVVGRVREMMERQVRHLTRMVDDLLDVSRITRGKLELRKDAVDLASAVGRTVEATRPLFEDRQQTLTVDLPPVPVRLEADPTRLEQVLANLLNNAAKYTDHGGHVWLTARQEGGELVLRVKDTGVGIAADLLPRIFEPFVQADRVMHQSQGGLGIGLTLVRRLVEMHAGSVTAHSEGPGKGSEFVVRLPAPSPVQPGPDTRAAVDGGGPAAAAPRRRVLVVDDNVDAAESLALLLRMAGHAVRVAHDGPAALAAAEADPPDLVFLDIGMPAMNGYDVARRLRQRPGLDGVVLVAVTGWGQDEDRRRSREAGFDHHLVKPAEPEALRRLLARPR